MNLLQRLAMMFATGRLPDPRTTRGLVVFTALGIGIGMVLYNLGAVGR